MARDFVLSLAGECEQKVFCFNHEKHTITQQEDGVEVIRAGSFAKISSQPLSLSYKKLLKKTFDGFQPDVVVFHFPNPFGARYLLKILKKRPDVKLLIYYHLDIIKQKLLGKFFKGQTKRLMARASKVLATSPVYAQKSKVLSALGEKCTVVPLCVNSQRITPDAQSERLAEKIREENAGKTILFAVGRHVPYKGMEYLIRASKLLSGDFKIFIGGQGPLTPSLKKLAAGDDKITFLGAMNDDALKAYYSACDIFCFPSITKNEAFGLSLAEAMSFGKPAVTFSIEGSGVNFVNLKDVTGLEVPNRDVGAYAAAIVRLSSDGALRQNLGEAAKQRVRDLFTSAQFAHNVREIVSTL